MFCKVQKNVIMKIINVNYYMNNQMIVQILIIDIHVNLVVVVVIFLIISVKHILINKLIVKAII